MQKADNENDKAQLYDQYISQKYIDELPTKNTLKLKISSALRCVVRDWHDDMTEDEIKKKECDEMEKLKRAASKDMKQPRLKIKRLGSMVRSTSFQDKIINL